ncbi:MAG: GWxTD domain-containing protein [Ignavibacteriales bacterium]|nr:GWxTD domain-containing protein [Ignavibacteriales bacterium]
MKAFITALSVLLFISSAFAQPDNTSLNKKQRVKYYQEFLCFSSGKENLTRVDVFIQVPYSEIQFVKNGQSFIAQYSLTISVFDENREKLINEKIWNEKIIADGFDQTLSKENFNLSLKSVELKPGNYVIRTAMEDKDSRKEFSVDNNFIVRDFSSGIDISDIMLIAKQEVVDGSNKIRPNVSKDILVQRDGIQLFYEIYSDSSNDVLMDYSITDKDENVVHKQNEIINLKAGTNQIFKTIKDSALSLGSHKLLVSIFDLKSKLITSATKIFISRWSGVPGNVQDLEKAIEQMTYIASNEELDFIEEAEIREDKVKRFLDFWKSKDPNPQDEQNEVFNEYYRRVAYANEQFSHYNEGWQTDRGMVYILLGPPNNIDRHPFDYDSKPYEVWQYYDINRQFVFLDDTGFGDYRLVTPLYGDDYRYR